MDDRTVTGRVLAILDALAEAPVASLGLADLTQATGIPKPTVRRIANDLVTRSVLVRGAGGYCMGPRVLALGAAAGRQLISPEALSPFVHDLHQRTGTISWVARTQGAELLIIDSAHTRAQSRLMTHQLWPLRFNCERLPSSAAGQLVALDNPDAVERILQAGLPRLTPHTRTMAAQYLTRLRHLAENGVATEYEECRQGWWCAAARLDEPHANIVVGITGTVAGQPIARTLKALRNCRDELSRELPVHELAR